MTINHIDQLTQWWESAEKGAPSKGDAIIRRTERLLSNGYAYEVGTEDYTDAKHLDNVRILARAPKPKPAWHDAVAVKASMEKPPAFRDVWVNDDGEWRNVDGDLIDPSDLRDVTPLIEAKVTDEMLLRALNAAHGSSARSLDWYSDSEAGDMRDALTAALGLETA